MNKEDQDKFMRIDKNDQNLNSKSSIGEYLWDDLVLGNAEEDDDLVQILKYEMGLDIKKYLENPEKGKDSFVQAFNGFLGLEGQAFLKHLNNLENTIQADFMQPLEFEFKKENK